MLSRYFSTHLIAKGAYSVQVQGLPRKYKCTIPTCPVDGFQYPKDLVRHNDSVHSNEVPGTRRFYCRVEKCKHSEKNMKGLARLDNLNRHMRKAHPEISERVS